MRRIKMSRFAEKSRFVGEIRRTLLEIEYMGGRVKISAGVVQAITFAYFAYLLMSFLFYQRQQQDRAFQLPDIEQQQQQQTESGKFVSFS